MPSSCNHSSAANVGGNAPRTKGQVGRLLLNTKWLPYTRGNLVPDQNKLSKYWAKRDFTKITEPSGRRKILPSVRRRFVIQKHAATRLHYDLGLELDDVFKSWAVTKGPSLDPHGKRLAVQVEDHPLDYGDFEGTIPAAEYGGGTVQPWDRGFWQPDGSETLQQSLPKGGLRFTLEGGTSARELGVGTNEACSNRAQRC
jgi:DNA ligase D-like protein (predicted 3'-phosphoesterase)